MESDFVWSRASETLNNATSANTIAKSLLVTEIDLNVVQLDAKKIKGQTQRQLISIAQEAIDENSSYIPVQYAYIQQPWSSNASMADRYTQPIQMTPDENRSVANGLATVASSIDLSIIHPQERYKMRQAAVRDYVYNTGSNLTKYINTLTAFLQSVK
jgi:hypothetical protein